MQTHQFSSFFSPSSHQLLCAKLLVNIDVYLWHTSFVFCLPPTYKLIPLAG